MYQGENAKYDIRLEDESGNIISPSSIARIKLFIYNENTKEIVIRRYYNIEGEADSISVAGDFFRFVINSSDTLNLQPVRFRLRIDIMTTDADFNNGEFVNIEDAPIFSIERTVNDTQ